MLTTARQRGHREPLTTLESMGSMMVPFVIRLHTVHIPHKHIFPVTVQAVPDWAGGEEWCRTDLTGEDTSSVNWSDRWRDK